MKSVILTLFLTLSSLQLVFAEYTNAFETSYSDSLILCLNTQQELSPGSYCDDIIVFNYSDVQSLQLAIDYNVNKIVWDTALQFNELAKISIYDTNLAEPGNFRISWAHPAGLSSFLDDGEILFKICYDVLETASSNDIYLSSNISGGIEATNNEGVEIPISFSCNILNGNKILPASNISFFPNPVLNEIILSSDTQISGPIEIFDTSGRRILNIKSPLSQNGRIAIPVNGLNRGTYIVRFIQRANIITFKFIKI